MARDIFFGAPLSGVYAAKPLTLVDVGARGGLQPNWKAAREHLRVIGFEPDPQEYARLSHAGDATGRTLYIDSAAHRERAELTLNVGRNAGTSSLLEPNLAYLSRFPEAERFDVVRRVSVKVDALDELLAARGIDGVDFLKIDTQGAELAILEGARRTLTSAFGVELEVNFAPLYVDQPSFGALDALLRDSGLQLMDLRPAYWKRALGARYGGPKGQLVFGDALYLKTEEALQERLARLADPDEQRGVLLHALSISLLYGYADYALQLLHPNRGLLDPAHAVHVERELKADVRWSTRLPHFRGRGWLSHFFYRIHRLLYPTHGGWASGGRHLGNVD
jgi:FkbM family methyltransferase